MVEVGLDQAPEVPDREVDAREAVSSELANDELQDRAVGDRYERLGQHGRVGTQPRPLATRQDHCGTSGHERGIDMAEPTPTIGTLSSGLYP